jgi:glucose/arabinose dehydrogenase
MRPLALGACLLLLAASGPLSTGSARAATPLDDPIPAPVLVGDVEVSLQEIASGLAAPNWGTNAGDGSGRLFVVDQPGVVYAVSLVSEEKWVFLDVSPRLVPLGSSFDERGLLGLAFHPDYPDNGRLYTFTSEPVAGPADFTVELPAGTSPNHQSVVTEWTVPDPTDPNALVDPNSARELLRIDEPQGNHNGGALSFGLDGLLYIALGDGGGGDDQGTGHGSTGNGQDLSNVLGTLLRIDVDGTNASNGQYGVPDTNPFVEGEGVDEIFAFGLRNPFRISFDLLTGDLYIADVGQGDIEEIDLGVAGGNYGWNLKEGSFFFDTNGAAGGFVTDVDPGVPPGLVDPIAEYDHDEGSAVIGGFVYRGAAIPDLVGHYVFGDFSGRLFYLDDQTEIRELEVGGSVEFELRVLGFGQDESGEIYIMANPNGRPVGEAGVVLRIGPPDSDADGVPDDGNGSGILGDLPCAPGETWGCDDSCASVANGGQADSDADGVGDACDSCRSLPNGGPIPPGHRGTGGQTDDDLDGIGNLCDADFTEGDGDGFVNVTDLLRFLDAFGRTVGASSCPDSHGDPIGLCGRYDLNVTGDVINVTDLLVMIDPELFGTPTAAQGCAPDDSGTVQCPLECEVGPIGPTCPSDDLPLTVP